MRGVHRTVVSWILVVAMVFTPFSACAQQPASAEDRATASDSKVDLGYVTPDAVAAEIARSRHVLSAPEMEMMPIEVISALGKKEMGIDPVQIVYVLAIVEAPTTGSPPAAGIVMRMATPVDSTSLLKQLSEQTVADSLDGKPYRRGREAANLSIYQPDDHTVLMAHDSLLRKMLANRAAPKPGPVRKLLDNTGSPDLVAVLAVAPIRDLISAPLSMAPIPPPFDGVKKLPELVSSVEAKVSVTGGQEMSLRVRARDEAAAKELAELIDGWMAAGKQMFLAQMSREMKGDDPVERAGAQYARRVVEKTWDLFRPVREKDSLVLATGAQKNSQMQIATTGILVALLLPAVQAAREAARRSQSTNNLKQIGLAMHNYHAANKAFPPAFTCDAEGKPLLSWRVSILPYLDQENLYKQFHLDEPWNSEHNRKLIPLMPKLYQNPSGRNEPGKAHYLAVAGKGLMFEGQKGRTFSGVTDGTANTVMVVEANDDHAVIWTKPDDWKYDPKLPLSGLGNAHPGGFLALFADGSVRFISKTIDPRVWRALLTIAGGETAPGR